MSRISDKLIDIAEKIEDLYNEGCPDEQIESMLQKDLEDWEYEFYKEHEESVWDTLKSLRSADSEEWTDPAGGEHYGDEDPGSMYESMEFFGEIGAVGLTAAYIYSVLKEKGTDYPDESWKNFLINKLTSIPGLNKFKVRREITAGLEDYENGDIDLDELDEILFRDPRFKKAIADIQAETGTAYAYRELYYLIKKNMKTFNIDDTPGKKIYKGYKKRRNSMRESIIMPSINEFFKESRR